MIARLKKFRRWHYAAIIGLLSLYALLCIPFDIFSQTGLTDLLYAQTESAGDSPAPFDSDNDEPSKTTCLRIIREDYEGFRLSYPGKIFVDTVKKEIYVIDSGNNRVLVYTHDFYPLLSISKPDGIEMPVGVAVNPEGYLYIVQAPTKKETRGRISVLNPCLRWKKDIFFDGFAGADSFHPTDLAINREGFFYVTGISFRGVVVLDKNGIFSHLLTPTDRLGKGPVEKPAICDVEIDNKGQLYLLSEDMGRIFVYDSQERFLFKFGQKGGSVGKMSRPRGIAIDSSNKRIYVIDYMRHTAGSYSFDGRFLFEFGGLGWAKGWFQYPNDIAVDTFGNVLVSDTFNNRVQVIKIEGLSSTEEGEEVASEIILKEELAEQTKPKSPAKEKSAEETKPAAPVSAKLAEPVKPKAPVRAELVSEAKPSAPVKEAIEEPTIVRPKPTKYYILTANMNLREKNTTESKVIRLMNIGEEFEITDQYMRDDFNTWYKIKTISGQAGWFCGTYNGIDKFIEKGSARIPSIAKVEVAKPDVPVKKALQKPKIVKPKPEKRAELRLLKPVPTKYYILISAMNLREKNTTASKLIQQMERGEEFEIIDQYKHDDSNTWYLINTKSGLTGWFCGTYNGIDRFIEKGSARIPPIAKVKVAKPDVPVKKALQKPKPEKPTRYYILTANMKLREKNTTKKSKIIRVMEAGEQFEIIDQFMRNDYNTWYKIKTKSGQIGWICGIYHEEAKFKEKGQEAISSIAKVEVAKSDVPVKKALQKPKIVKPAQEEPKPAKYYILMANMNLREKNTTASKVIRLMDIGEELLIIDQYKQDNLNIWYKIKTRSGESGWICGICNGETKFMKKN